MTDPNSFFSFYTHKLYYPRRKMDSSTFKLCLCKQNVVGSGQDLKLCRFCELPSIYLRMHSTISAVLMGGNVFNHLSSEIAINSENIYLFKTNNRNIRKSCEICSEIPLKRLEGRFDIFIVNFKHISHLFLVFLLLSLSLNR